MSGRRIALPITLLAAGLLAGCHGQDPGPAPTTATATTMAPAPDSWLGRQYELDPATKGEPFRLVPHDPMFVAWHYTTDPNEVSNPDPSQDLYANEVEFQLSFKSKIWPAFIDDRLDLWIGYTQQTHIQVLQRSLPIRTTDYTPEAFLTGRIDCEAGPLQWRTLSLGFIHESNGEAGSISRTWNRIFAEFGLERGDFDLLVRPWWRVKESQSVDDNPDISKFMGPGDLVARYEHGGYAASLLLRNNFNLAENRGGYELTAFAPSGISKRLKFFARWFYGFGETLIDYDHRQQAFALGLAFTDWD